MLIASLQRRSLATIASFTSTALQISMKLSSVTSEYVATSHRFPSANLRTLLVQHDGDTDTRGVADFSGNPIVSKLGDPGEGDDDDIDEDGEEEGSIRSGSKRRVHANDPMNTSDVRISTSSLTWI